MTNPTLADMIQVLGLIAIPAAILLTVRYLNRREARTQVVDTIDGSQRAAPGPLHSRVGLPERIVIGQNVTTVMPHRRGDRLR